jgi:hypothetical protein
VGNGYKLLLTLHLLCVIGGFGYLAYTGFTLLVGRHRGAAVGTLEVTLQVSVLAELLVYGALVFGVAAVGSSQAWGFGQTWVYLALILYLVDIGLLHAIIRPAQREYSTLAHRLAAAPSGPATALSALAAALPELRSGPPPEVGRIESLEKRIALGWGLFNIVVVAVVFLMVFKPGV